MIKKLRAKTTGTKHTVAAILANPLASKLMQGMSVHVMPCRELHGRAMTTATTPRGCMNLRIDMAQGKEGGTGCDRKHFRRR